MDYAATAEQALARIAEASGLDPLEQLRVEFVGKQGSISGLLKTLGAMSADDRQALGPQIHALRESVSGALAARKEALEGAALTLTRKAWMCGPWSCRWSAVIAPSVLSSPEIEPCLPRNSTRSCSSAVKSSAAAMRASACSPVAA